MSSQLVAIFRASPDIFEANKQEGDTALFMRIEVDLDDDWVDDDAMMFTVPDDDSYNGLAYNEVVIAEVYENGDVQDLAKFDLICENVLDIPSPILVGEFLWMAEQAVQIAEDHRKGLFHGSNTLH